MAVALDEPTGICQVAQQLSDEQRVALGLDMDGLGELDDRDVERVACGDLDELLHLGLAQAGQLDPRDMGLPAQIGEHAGQRVRAIEVGVAERADGEQAGRSDPHDVAQEQQRRLGGPLQIVQDEQQRNRQRHPGEHGADRLEHAVAAGLGLVASVRADERETVGDPGHQPRQIGPVCTYEVAQLVGRTTDDQRSEGVHEGLVRHTEFLVAASVEHRRAVCGVDSAGQLGHEPRLANPRFPGHEHETRRARERLAPTLLEHRHLSRPADEHEPPRRVERIGQRRAKTAAHVPVHRARV